MEYKEFFDLAKKRGITNIQVTEFTNNDIVIKYIDEKLDINDSCFTISYSIKAERNGKTVKITSDYLDEKILDLIEMKLEYTDTFYNDEYLVEKTNNNVELNGIDISKEQEELKEIYKLKQKSKYIKTIESKISASEQKTKIVNSNGVDISTASEVYRCYCEILLEKDNILVSHNKSLLKVNKEDINITQFVEDTIKEAEKMVTKEEVKTSKYDIVLSNEVASSIISTIIESGVSANNIRQKTSIFADKLNKKIFGSNINIVEDPQNKNFPGYTLFDNEGTDTLKKEIIKEGVLQTYLYDIKEAKMSNKKSTGNSYGGIGTRNLYLPSVNYSKEALFEKMKNVLYITDYMGSQNTSINISTGNISLQVFGFIIKDGQIKCGFVPCIMTTTIKELLNSVEAIGNDLDFFSKSAGSPSMLVKNISIAGK